MFAQWHHTVLLIILCRVYLWRCWLRCVWTLQREWLTWQRSNLFTEILQQEIACKYVIAHSEMGTSEKRLYMYHAWARIVIYHMLTTDFHSWLPLLLTHSHYQCCQVYWLIFLSLLVAMYGQHIFYSFLLTYSYLPLVKPLVLPLLYCESTVSLLCIHVKCSIMCFSISMYIC